MPGRLAGQLVDGGEPVADEPVFVVDTASDDESNWSIVATDRSAADGSWSVTVPDADAERYHAVAQFEESGTLKNALSKPFLTSQPFAQAGVVSVDFDVLSPTLSVRSSPEKIHRWKKTEGSGTTISDSIGDKSGSINGASWVSNDWQGGFALDYDGDDDHVEIEDSGDILPDERGSVGLTFETANDDQNAVILTKGEAFTTFGDSDEIWCGIVGDELRFYFNQDDDSDQRTEWSGWQTGEKYRVLFTYEENAQIEMFVNNDLKDTETVGSLGGSSDPLYFGKNVEENDRAYEGRIDDVIFYDGVLSEDDISTDYDLQPWS